MQFTRKPKKYDKYPIRDEDRNVTGYCTASYGYALPMPDDDGFAEIALQISDGDDQIICVRHKQEYPDKRHSYQSKDVAELSEMMSKVIHWQETKTETARDNSDNSTIFGKPGKIVDDALVKRFKAGYEKNKSGEISRKTFKNGMNLPSKQFNKLFKEIRAEEKTSCPYDYSTSLPTAYDNSAEETTTYDNSTTATTKKKEPAVAPQIMRDTNKQWLVGGIIGKVNLYRGVATAIDPETGEVITQKFRGMESQHKSYKRLEDTVMTNLKPRKTVFISINFGAWYSANEITHIGAMIERWLNKRGIKHCGVMVYQPCETGQWHIHILLCSDVLKSEDERSEFERELTEWLAAKYNDGKDEHLLDLRYLPRSEDIMIKWAYLNPQKHPERAIYVPVGKQTFKTIGKMKSPPKPIITNNKAVDEWLKKVEARELPNFNFRKEFFDIEGYHLHTIDYSYFIISKKKSQDIWTESYIENTYNPYRFCGEWGVDWLDSERSTPADCEGDNSAAENSYDNSSNFEDLKEIVADLTLGEDKNGQLSLFPPSGKRQSSDEIYCRI